MNEIGFALLYFYHMDQANAAIHMTNVKFSPITFALAQKCIEDNIYTPVGIGRGLLRSAAAEVMSQKDLYPLDTGR